VDVTKFSKEICGRNGSQQETARNLYGSRLIFVYVNTYHRINIRACAVIWEETELRLTSDETWRSGSYFRHRTNVRVLFGRAGYMGFYTCR